MDGALLSPYCVEKDNVHFGSVITVLPDTSFIRENPKPQIPVRLVSIILCVERTGVLFHHSFRHSRLLCAISSSL